jgi:haloacetate dehalogenase
MDSSPHAEPVLAAGEPKSDVRDFLPGFAFHSIKISEAVTIHARSAGSGRPLLLMHGQPQTSATWYAVAPALSQRFTVVATDLRGYGDSSRPASDGSHAAYSKRRMALDQIEVMRQLGYKRFAVVGHDRGGRVAHRMARDHPQVVERLAVLDIAPTSTMYARTNREFATSYFWWFFLIQPDGLPERLIGQDIEFFFRDHLKTQSKTRGVPEETLVQEYLRCLRKEDSVHAICEDYRAAAGIDLEHDAVDDDAGKRLGMPLLALWGARGTVGHLYDVLDTWREKAVNVTGGALDCGHILQEEAPGPLLEQLLAFLDAGDGSE